MKVSEILNNIHDIMNDLIYEIETGNNLSLDYISSQLNKLSDDILNIEYQEKRTEERFKKIEQFINELSKNQTINGIKKDPIRPKPTSRPLSQKLK